MGTMTINGRIEPLPDDPDALLIDVVRDALNLTGTKLVCGAGRMRRMHRAGGRRAGGELSDACARCRG